MHLPLTPLLPLHPPVSLTPNSPSTPQLHPPLSSYSNYIPDLTYSRCSFANQRRYKQTGSRPSPLFQYRARLKQDRYKQCQLQQHGNGHRSLRSNTRWRCASLWGLCVCCGAGQKIISCAENGFEKEKGRGLLADGAIPDSKARVFLVPDGESLVKGLTRYEKTE